MFIITLDYKPATVQQLHKNEGWTYKAKGYAITESAFLVARTKRQAIELYESVLAIAWTQKQPDVRCERL